MSEERKNPGAELTEAALENVSGGIGDRPHQLALRRAQEICGKCRYSNVKKCGYGVEKLAEYVERNAMWSASSVADCPFYLEVQNNAARR